MVGPQEKILNSRCSRMAKTVTFYYWRQPFNSFYFEILSTFSFVSILSFCYAKKWGRGGGGGMPPAPSPGVAGPGKNLLLLLRPTSVQLWLIINSDTKTLWQLIFLYIQNQSTSKGSRPEAFVFFRISQTFTDRKSPVTEPVFK